MTDTQSLVQAVNDVPSHDVHGKIAALFELVKSHLPHVDLGGIAEKIKEFEDKVLSYEKKLSDLEDKLNKLMDTVNELLPVSNTPSKKSK